MDHASIITFFHWFLVTGAVVTLILVAMAFHAMSTNTDSYDDEPQGGSGH